MTKKQRRATRVSFQKVSRRFLASCKGSFLIHVPRHLTRPLTKRPKPQPIYPREPVLDTDWVGGAPETTANLISGPKPPVFAPI